MSKYTFGDIVRNEWADEGNPQKILLFVRMGRLVTCLALDGESVKFDNDKQLRLTKVGSLDFAAWRQIANDDLTVLLPRRYQPEAATIIEAVKAYGDDSRSIVNFLKSMRIVAQTTYWQDVKFFKQLQEYLKSKVKND